MNIRLILRLRRQLAEVRQQNACLEGEVWGLNEEIADVRVANAELREQEEIELAWRLDAVTAIEQYNVERARLLVELEKALEWATEVGRTNACIDQRNRHLAADNERLRGELAARTRPVARVIPLQKRGAA